MAAHHSAVLPAVALQLAVRVEHYRKAMRELAAHPDDEAAREAAFLALRAARPLASAVPAVWAAWGEMNVRHFRFMQERLEGAGAEALRRSWRQLEDRAEIVAQHCVDWALRRQTQHAVARHVAAPFFAWDQARRDAFALERQLGAAPRPGALSDEAAQRYETSVRESARLLAEAVVALEGRVPPRDPPAEVHLLEDEAQGELHRFLLIEQWRVAEEAAADAELAVMQLQLTGLPVGAEQQALARALRAEARKRREAVFSASRL